MSPHRRRASDRHWVRVRENWYRDLWLAAISAVVVLALISAQDAVNQIQRSRLASCQAQNQRHRAAESTLDQQLGAAERHATPKRRAELEASHARAIALIDQLTPLQNCQAVLRRQSAPAAHPPH